MNDSDIADKLHEARKGLWIVRQVQIQAERIGLSDSVDVRKLCDSFRDWKEAPIRISGGSPRR